MIDDMFSEVHPDKYTRPIETNAVSSGRHHDKTKYKETAFIRCRKCLHIYNTDRHPAGWGEGVSNTTHSYTQGGITKYYGDPDVSGGCPFCGTYIR